jgi:hypothetical protein
MTVKQRLCVIFAVAVLSFSAPAWAGSILDLPVGQGGKVAYGVKGRTPVYGSGIPLTELIYGTKTLGMSSGRLFFVTGKSSTPNSGSLFFAPGGGFAVRGCVDANGDQDRGCGDKKDIRGVLMKGTFLGAELTKQNGETILIAQFLEQLNPALAKLLNLPDQSEGVMRLILTGSLGHPCWNLDTVNGGSLALLSEPASIATSATSLVGMILILGGTAFRRRNKVRF